MSSISPLILPDDEVGLLLKALTFAAERHAGQMRKGGAGHPYINHLIEVATLLWFTGGVRDATVLIAGILHDTIEDTATTPDELTTLFGDEVSSLVREVTDEKGLSTPERRRRQVDHARHLTPNARLIKIADKTANIRDMGDSPPLGWSIRDRLGYIAWGEQVVDQIRGTNEALESKFKITCRKAREKMSDEPESTLGSV